MICNIERYVQNNDRDVEPIHDVEIVWKTLETAIDANPCIRIKCMDSKTIVARDWTAITKFMSSHLLNAIAEPNHRLYDDCEEEDDELHLHFYGFSHTDDDGRDFWTDYALVDQYGDPVDVRRPLAWARERIQAQRELEEEERRNPRREPHETFPPTRHTWMDSETGEEREYYTF